MYQLILTNFFVSFTLLFSRPFLLLCIHLTYACFVTVLIQLLLSFISDVIYNHVMLFSLIYLFRLRPIISFRPTATKRIIRLCGSCYNASSLMKYTLSRRQQALVFFILRSVWKSEENEKKKLNQDEKLETHSRMRCRQSN